MRSKKFSAVAEIKREFLAMWRDRDGVAAVMMAVSLPALLAFTALAIDMSYAYWMRTQLQHTASAAALAGASQLYVPTDTENTVKAEAILYANLNMDPTRFGTTLLAANVVLGNWDPGDQLFTPMGTTGANGAACDNPAPEEIDTDCLVIDAVEVTTRKAQANGNQLNLFLGAAVGLAETDISTVAIAWSVGGGAPEADCYTRGILAGGVVDMDGHNTFTDEFCVYGEEGVKIQSDNCFQGPFEDCGTETMDPGVEIMTPGFWDEQGGPNPGFDEAKRVGNQDPTLAEQVDDNIQAAEEGFESGSWSALGFGYEAITELIVDPGTHRSNPKWPNSIYVVDGKAEIGDIDHVAVFANEIIVKSHARLNHVILVAKKEIVIDAEVIDHAVIASRGLIKIGSDVRLGGPPGTACDPISVAVFSRGEFTIQSNTTFRNAQLVTNSKKKFDLNSNNTFEGVAIQSLDNIDMGSDNEFLGCSLSGAGTPGPGSGLTLRLVH